MPTIDEKRVYTDNAGTETVLLATGLGVVSVSVSDDLIGEFGVVRRCEARDVATAGSLVAVATEEDVLLADRSDADVASDAATSTATQRLDFAETGFGPATAVGFDEKTLLAGDESGRVARSAAEERLSGPEGGERNESDGTAWTEVGTTGAVRAVEGGLVAAADGVYRVGSAGVTHAGLDDARDVDAEPLVATGSGLYKLGNGWMDVLDGPVDALDAAGERGLAAVDGALYARGLDTERAADVGDAADRSGVPNERDDDGRSGAANGEDGDDWDGIATDGWTEAVLPVDGDVVAVTHGVDASYAVTADGTLAVRLPDGAWRYRGLGVRDVAAAAV
ncbi:HVO_0234 family beta-propeller protein [Halobellus litoreus]|uniref:HVO-0234-like beta-propeller domain-containing protein n=1 Tax=Halobellus litoreus TaxID=755310 RepID=A0ABD6DTK3_9EURY